MDEARRQITDEATSELQQLLYGVQIATAPDWLELRLTIAQLRCLFGVQLAGTSSVGGLAKMLAVGAPTASTVVEQLVQLGYLERANDPRDRRRALLRVAPSGQDLLAGLRHGRYQVIESWLVGLTDGEVEELCTSLRRLVTSMRAIQDSPPLAIDSDSPAKRARPAGD